MKHSMWHFPTIPWQSAFGPNVTEYMWQNEKKVREENKMEFERGLEAMKHANYR
jgi:hypothetical protein